MAEITKGLLAACKVLVAAIPNPMHPARMQGQAAIELAELRHVPRQTGADLDYLDKLNSGEFDRCNYDRALRQQMELQGVTGRTM